MIFNLGFHISIFFEQIEVMDHKVIGFISILQLERLKMTSKGLKLSRVVKLVKKSLNRVKTTHTEVEYKS